MSTMSVIKEFSYKGMPRILIPENGGFTIFYQCSECRKTFYTSVVPPEVWYLVENRPLGIDVKEILKSILPPDEYKAIFETGICKRCEDLRKFSGNHMKEKEYERRT